MAIADRSEPARRTFLATIGDVAGNVFVTGQPNYVYITQIGRSTVRKALNVRVRPRAGLSVVCGYTAENPTVLQVLEVDWGGNPEPGDLSYLPAHHESHELGGGDEVWLAKEQITALAPYPTNPVSNQIHIQADFYAYGATLNYWPGGLTIDFVTFLPTYLPTAHHGVYVTVSIDGATNLLQYTAGTEFPSWPPPPIGTAIPAPPLGSVPIAAVYLVAGPNLLPNDPGLLADSFEVPGAGGPDIWANWIEFVAAGALANDAVIFYVAGGGLNSCQATEGGGGSDTGVYQDFVVTPGLNYQLRFWTRDDGGANDGQYRIYDVTNAADIVAMTGTGAVGGPAWVEVTQVFTAPVNCVTVRAYFYCPGAGAAVAWFDDMTVALVPSSLDWNEIRDIRQISSPMGGSTMPMAHDILSVSHSGTMPAVVVRGDLMTGQGVAPLWMRLAHPGFADRVLQSTALEMGWSAGSLILGGFTLTVPATGTAVIGGGAGAANQIAYWTDANTLAGDAGLVYNAGTNTITISGAINPVAAAGQNLGDATHRWKVYAAYVDAGNGGWFGILGNEQLTVNAAGNFTFSGVGSVVVPDGCWVGADAACSWVFDSTNGDVTTLDSVGVGTAAPGQMVDIAAGANQGLRIASFEILRRADVASTMMLRPTIVNGWGVLCVVPNGTGAASLEFFGTDYQADAVNYERLAFVSRAAVPQPHRIFSNAAGTGTRRDIAIFADQAGWNAAGNQLYLAAGGTVGIAMVPTANGVLSIGLPTENLEIIDAGSAGATEQDWIEVEVGGVQGFIRVFAAI